MLGASNLSLFLQLYNRFLAIGFDMLSSDILLFVLPSGLYTKKRLVKVNVV